MPFVNENSSPSLAGDLSEYLFGFSNPNSHRAQQERVATTAFERQKELLGLEQQFNSAEAAKQRAFEEYMSNSAYQRKMADLKAAGLNPALAVIGNAQGASTPSGVAASSGSPGSVNSAKSSSISQSIGAVSTMLLAAAKLVALAA